jgi:hypothetical protein
MCRTQLIHAWKKWKFYLGMVTRPKLGLKMTLVMAMVMPEATAAVTARITKTKDTRRPRSAHRTNVIHMPSRTTRPEDRRQIPKEMHLSGNMYMRKTTNERDPMVLLRVHIHQALMLRTHAPTPRSVIVHRHRLNFLQLAGRTRIKVPRSSRPRSKLLVVDLAHNLLPTQISTLHRYLPRIHKLLL